SARDGHSTAGTSGIGLGAVRRLSRGVDVFSRPGAGTVLAARFPSARPAAAAAGRIAFAALSVAKAGESECGDGCVALTSAEAATFVVVDGLGHGPGAAEAAGAALRAAARTDAAAAPEALLEAMHRALHGSRGA